MTILVIDQLCGLSPYQLHQEPMLFSDLLPGGAHWAELLAASSSWRQPQVIEHVEESYRPPYATTVLREGKNGQAEVWKMRWDSSG